MHDRIAAVVLAAGMSRRMGRPKALLPMGGLPMIVRVVEPLVEIKSIFPIVVVTGHQADQVVGAMDGCPVEFVHNSKYEAGGMLSSVKIGCRAVLGRCDAFFLALGDQPLVGIKTYRALVGLLNREAAIDTPLCAEHRLAVSQIVHPTFDGRRGHPILLSANCISEILSLPTDATLKTFTQRIETHEVAVDDPGVVSDIDTPEDYDRALIEFGAHRSEPCNSKV